MEIEQLESKIENADAKPNLGKLDQLASQAQESSSGAGFMEPGTKTKTPGKRGRKSKEELAKIAAEQKKAASGSNPQDPQTNPQGPQGPAQPLPPSAESLMAGKFVTKSISSLGVAVAGDARAMMNPDELDAGAEVLARLMDKYLPQIMGQYGLEAGALMVFGQYGLRVFAIKRAKQIEEFKRQKEMHEKMQNPPPPPGPSGPKMPENPPEDNFTMGTKPLEVSDI